MYRVVVFLYFFLIQIVSGFSQELKCSVEITAGKLQTTEARVFKTLESAVFEFMNNRKWTEDIFKNEEKIECSIFINVVQESGSGVFRATANIQSSRTIFNSDYNTVLFNYPDRDWVFAYTEFLPLEFNENAYITNLTSMLAYYAYVIIGLDYDSYSLNGGRVYFQKAQTIIDNVPASLGVDNAPGWTARESTKNRYWLMENLLNARYSVARTVTYDYNINGLDVMYDDMKSGRKVVLDCLSKMSKLSGNNPNLMIARVFFDSKSDELVNIFSGATPNEKATAVQYLYKADPGNSSKYARIMK